MNKLTFIIISFLIIIACSENDSVTTPEEPKITIDVISPENNSNLEQGDSVKIDIEVNAENIDDFSIIYELNGNILDEKNKVPYYTFFSSDDGDVGSNEITVKAMRDDKIIGSDKIKININPLKGCSITSPVENEVFYKDEMIKIEIKADDNIDLIDSVKLVFDNKLIKTFKEPPFIHEINNKYQSGESRIEASVYYRNDDEFEVEPINIRYNPYSEWRFNSPLRDEDFLKGDTIKIDVGTDAEMEKIEKVNFYINNNFLTSISEQPYTYEMENQLDSGSYDIKAEIQYLSGHKTKIHVFINSFDKCEIEGRVTLDTGYYLSLSDLIPFKFNDAPIVLDEEGYYTVIVDAGDISVSDEGYFEPFDDTFEALEPRITKNFHLTPKMNDYLPLKTGNWWLYSNSEESHIQDDIELTTSLTRLDIISSTVEDNIVTYTLSEHTYDHKKISYNYTNAPVDTTYYEDTTEVTYIRENISNNTLDIDSKSLINFMSHRYYPALCGDEYKIESDEWGKSFKIKKDIGVSLRYIHVSTNMHSSTSEKTLIDYHIEDE